MVGVTIKSLLNGARVDDEEIDASVLDLGEKCKDLSLVADSWPRLDRQSPADDLAKVVEQLGNRLWISQ